MPRRRLGLPQGGARRPARSYPPPDDRGSCLVVGSGYHKNTNTERTKGVISDTLRANAKGRQDEWDSRLPLTGLAINKAASALGGDLTPLFVDRGAHPRLALSPARDARTADASPPHRTIRP